MVDKPNYTHEFTVGEETEWDDLPKDMIATAENETDVKIILLDEYLIRIVHAKKEAIRVKEIETVDEFREYVDWDFYS